MADIQISDLSNGTVQVSDGKYIWSGTGIFDRLMMAVNGNIKVQFDNGHINTTDYASVYLGALQSVIASSMDFLLKEKLVEEQVNSEQKNQLIKDKQGQLIDRQRVAYDDNLRIEEAKARKDVVFSYNLGGQAVPTDQLTAMNTAVDAIAP